MVLMEQDYTSEIKPFLFLSTSMQFKSRIRYQSKYQSKDTFLYTSSFCVLELILTFAGVYSVNPMGLKEL